MRPVAVERGMFPFAACCCGPIIDGHKDGVENTEPAHHNLDPTSPERDRWGFCF